MLFIDASKDFKKERAKNYLLSEHLEKIFQAYVDRKDVERYAHLASFDEIKENGFNLNIPRYVDTSEEEEEIDLQAVFRELAEIEREEAEVDRKLAGFFAELGISMK